MNMLFTIKGTVPFIQNIATPLNVGVVILEEIQIIANWSHIYERCTD